MKPIAMTIQQIRYSAFVWLASFLYSHGENVPIEPLFPVQLDHEFAEAEATFDEVRKLILESYYSEEITEESLYWAAIQGMLRHISPPQNPQLAKIWTADEYESILQSLEGVQVSIGVKSSFNAIEGSLTITEVIPNSPSESILQPYDRILRIEDQSLKGKSLSEVNKLLNGEENTSVKLTINRDIRVFDIVLTREKFKTDHLSVFQIQKRLALVELRSFPLGISVDLKSELTQLDDETDSIILDLRNNQGGVFAEALRVAELFLAEKEIILRTFDRKKQLQNYVSSNPSPFPFRLAILTNKNTASAAEILAGSLRDHKRAFILGIRTYGKGVFENTFTLENNYRVKFITGAMYTPVGTAWQGIGIIPDFLIEQDDKTLETLRKLPLTDRLPRDVAIITATKLLAMEQTKTPQVKEENEGD